jgi:hypothetical protein
MNFVIYRVFLIPFEVSLFPVSDEEKKRILSEEIFTNVELRTPRGKQFAMRILQVEDGAILGKIAHMQIERIISKADTDFEPSDVENWPFIFFIFHTKTQTLVTEYKTSFQSDYKYLGSSLSAAISEKLRPRGLEAKLTLIAEKTAFWTAIERAEKIFSLRFKFHSPNMFGASSNANQSLAELKNLYNSTDSEIKLSNDAGKLKVDRNQLGSFVEYCDEGGGEWMIGKQDRNVPGKTSIKSQNSFIKFQIDIDHGEIQNAVGSIVDTARKFFRLGNDD